MSLYNGLIVKASDVPDMNVNWTEGYFTTPSETLLGPVTYVPAGALSMTPPAAGYEYVAILQIAGADQAAENNPVIPGPFPGYNKYALLAQASITNVGATVITGDVDVSPAGAITPGPWTVHGTIHNGDSVAAAAKAAAQAAFTAGQTLGLSGTTIPSALDGQVLTAGAYQFASGAATLATSGPGTLTLSGTGNIVIYTASTLTTGAGGTATVLFTGGASPKNVLWVIGSSATLGVTGADPHVFGGTLIAQTSVTLDAGTVIGSLAALAGSVTISSASVVDSSTSGGGGGATPAGTISIKYGTPVLISSLSHPDGRSPAVLPAYPEPDLDNYLLAFLFSPTTPWPSIPWPAPGAGAPGPMVHGTTSITNADIDNDVLSAEFGGRNGDIGD